MKVTQKLEERERAAVGRALVRHQRAMEDAQRRIAAAEDELRSDLEVMLRSRGYLPEHFATVDPDFASGTISWDDGKAPEKKDAVEDSLLPPDVKAQIKKLEAIEAERLDELDRRETAAKNGDAHERVC